MKIFNPQEYLPRFIDKFGQDLYDSIEQDDKSIMGKPCKLKNIDLTGIVERLWLPKSNDKNRPNNLWLIKWNNGKYGICDPKDIEI